MPPSALSEFADTSGIDSQRNDGGWSPTRHMDGWATEAVAIEQFTVSMLLMSTVSP